MTSCASNRDALRVLWHKASENTAPRGYAPFASANVRAGVPGLKRIEFGRAGVPPRCWDKTDGAWGWPSWAPRTRSRPADGDHQSSAWPRGKRQRPPPSPAAVAAWVWAAGTHGA